MRVNTFVKLVRELQPGEVVRINSINLSESGIDKLREYVQNGTLVPIKTEVMFLYKNVMAVMNGDVILPEMEYMKH